MKIVITTGLSGTDIGGPFQYAHNLEKEFQKLGHEVRVVSYGSVERSLPPWIRHLYFLFRIFRNFIWAEKVLTLDTYSVGVPSALVSKILRRQIVARVGGDFLWSAYINRTSEPLTLPNFYRSLPKLNLKERLIFFFMKWFFIKIVDFLAFNTEWQRNIWQRFYGIKEFRSGVVRNLIPQKRKEAKPDSKNFIWAGRLITEKNPSMLKKFNVDIITGESHEKVLEKLRSSYVAVSFALTDICPNFIIEAVSFGKPFIMTKETGLNEIYPHGGIFVNPLNDVAIEEAIQAMRDENTYNKCVRELKSLNLSHSWREMAQEYLDIWNRV